MLSINNRRHTLTNLLRDARFTLSVAVEGMQAALLAFGSMTGHASCCGPPGDCKYACHVSSSSWVFPGTTRPWDPHRAREELKVLPAHSASPAHMLCSVVSILSETSRHSAVVGESDDSVCAAGSSKPESGILLAAHAGGGSSSNSSGDIVATLDTAKGKRQRTCAPVQASRHSGPNHHHTLLLCRIDSAWVQKCYWHFGKVFGAAAAPDRSPSQPPPLAFAGSKLFAHILLAPFSLSGRPEAEDRIEAGIVESGELETLTAH
jgi:hypothetical protein